MATFLPEWVATFTGIRILIGYVFMSDRLIHFVVHVTIGGGRATSRNTTTDDTERDEFIIIEPNIETEANVLKWLRIFPFFNVWYFGEDSKEYANGVVVSAEGSWEAGVEGAKPGIV